MRTGFSQDLLADPGVAESERILRKCVHCGFCNATCPTYILLGDERDSPRGRIYLLKEIMERGGKPDHEMIVHVDRCLGCFSCMTTCPAGVDYAHLLEHGRELIETSGRRSWQDQLMRRLLVFVLIRPTLFRAMLLAAAMIGRFGRKVVIGVCGRLAGALRLVPPISKIAPPSPEAARGVYPAAVGKCRRRVALLPGCVQTVMAPEIHAASLRLLTKLGCEVVVVGEMCCGSLPQHMGYVAKAKTMAQRQVDALNELGQIDTIVVSVSGCGSTLKDYGHLLCEDEHYAKTAATVAALTRDISEFLVELIAENELPFVVGQPSFTVVYHAACSLQHGQRIINQPKHLLARAGFTVKEPVEAHICCGSAGTYNMLQPELADSLQQRKVRALEATGAAVVVTSNVGCLVQIRVGTDLPVIHIAELLDWRTGGPAPAVLQEAGVL